MIFFFFFLFFKTLKNDFFFFYLEMLVPENETLKLGLYDDEIMKNRGSA